MYWNNEKFDCEVISGLGAMALVGIWCVLYFRRYRVSLSEDGFVVERLWRKPFSIAWVELVKVRAPRGAQEVEFVAVGGRSIKISIYFPGVHPLLAGAKDNGHHPSPN
jgi:hypothetical protein